MPVHDALAVAALVQPDVIASVDALVTIDTTAGPARGMTLVDRYLLGDSEPNAQVAVGVDRDGFVELLCERLASLDRA